jgi:hypothetical protein
MAESSDTVDRLRKHSSQLAEVGADAQAEQNSHTHTECDNPLPPTSDVSGSTEVVKH